jgi:hypothetical protein
MLLRCLPFVAKLLLIEIIGKLPSCVLTYTYSYFFVWQFAILELVFKSETSLCLNTEHRATCDAGRLMMSYYTFKIVMIPLDTD